MHAHLGVTCDREALFPIEPHASREVAEQLFSADLDVLRPVALEARIGAHDLELAVGMGRTLGRRIAAVINRADLGNRKTEDYLKREGIPILTQIPFDYAVAKSYAAAKLPMGECEAFRGYVQLLGEKLLSMNGNES